ncbi:unnamed protein product [Lampetra planeri]
MIINSTNFAETVSSPPLAVTRRAHHRHHHGAACESAQDDQLLQHFRCVSDEGTAHASNLQWLVERDSKRVNSPIVYLRLTVDTAIDALVLTSLRLRPVTLPRSPSLLLPCDAAAPCDTAVL